jgi:hypothetical protein
MIARFKVGDWIINDQHEVFKIEKVGFENYTFEEVSGHNLSIRDVDHDFHLWSIEKDAKRGDILASNMSIVLFDELTHVGLFYGTCAYNLEKDQLDFPTTTYGQIYCKYYYPASEKQRQFFIKKLRDAGYKINSGGNLEELPPKTPEELINEIDISDEIKHTISSNFEFEELSSASVNDFIKGYERGMERMKQLILDKLNKK